MLKRYTVVAFQTISAGQDRKVHERGGGVCFVPTEGGTDWHVAVAMLAKDRFKHPLGRLVEIGVATLDSDLLSGICHSFGDMHWQGGDS